jgi:hypothetical protein
MGLVATHASTPRAVVHEWAQVRFVLSPTKWCEQGTISEYDVDLPRGHIATLRMVPTGGWDVEIVDRSTGTPTARGMFATTHDVLMLLGAEYPD